MLRHWTSAISAVLLLVCLASATSIHTGMPAPADTLAAPAPVSNPQWIVSPAVDSFLFQGQRASAWPVELSATSSHVAVDFGRSAPQTSALGESEPQRRLTFSILIVIALGVLLKWLTSGAFYELVSDACFMIFSIEDKAGRDRA